MKPKHIGILIGAIVLGMLGALCIANYNGAVFDIDTAYISANYWNILIASALAILVGFALLLMSGINFPTVFVCAMGVAGIGFIFFGAQAEKNMCLFNSYRHSHTGCYRVE